MLTSWYVYLLYIFLSFTKLFMTGMYYFIMIIINIVHSLNSSVSHARKFSRCWRYSSKQIKIPLPLELPVMGYLGGGSSKIGDSDSPGRKSWDGVRGWRALGMKHQRGFSNEGMSEQRSEVSEGPSQGQGCGKSSSLHREQQARALRFCSRRSRRPV